MRSRLPSVAALLLAVVTISHSSAPEAARRDHQGPATSTLDDQTDLSLTVYNSDLALVRDVRNVSLAPGDSDLHFMDIAATVNPSTVHFRSLSEPQRVHVIEQNYEYDLLEPDKLLRKIDLIAQREHRSRSGQMIALLSEIVWTKYGEDGERKKTDDD